MRKLLWIGSFVDVETESYLKEKIQYKKPSTSLSQRNILQGIEEVTGRYFDTIGVASLHGFPRDRRLLIPSVVFDRPNGKHGKMVGFFNMLYLNKLTSSNQLSVAVKRWIRINKDCGGVDVFVYEVRSACLKAAMLVKKFIPNSKIHLIAPDIPDYMDLQMSSLKQLLKRLDRKLLERYLPEVDCFILYTSAMAQKLGIANRPWLLMEGSVNAQMAQKSSVVQSSEKNDNCTIMYSGSINCRFGIKNLIEAMDILGSDYTLWITGMGPDSQLVEEMAAQRSNVHFFGFLADQNDVIQMQSEATALVNMRDPKEPASEYCFPSKLFEYMLTGKPVLSCKLGGIPEEYFDYLIEMKDINPQDIAQAVERISKMGKEVLKQKGIAGRMFVLDQKNNVAQARRICNVVFAEDYDCAQPQH